MSAAGRSAADRVAWPGIGLVVLATLIFAAQDGITRHLASAYSAPMVVMVRFWFFAAFTLALAARQPGGIAVALRTAHPMLQVARGVLLVVQITTMSLAFVHLGVIEACAVAAINPLIVSVLSGPILGERMGWRRWTAVGLGFGGELIILNPGAAVFSPWALVPAGAAVMLAAYGVMTRLVSARDSSTTSFLYTGLAGGVAMTLMGIWFWQPMARADWGWMALLCLTSALGHWALIKAYSLAEAAALQPFIYLHLVWISGLGVWLFGEALRPNVVLGVAVVVGAGLFTLWRQRLRTRQGRPAANG